MPQFQATVKDVEQVWQSPDGKMTISKVTLDVNGQSVVAKTYSKAFTPGWSGTIESYEKDGRNGPETFVKQPQKEGFGGGGNFGGNRGGGKPMADPFTMYLSYAKDIAVAMIKDGGLDEGKFGAVLEAVIEGGKTLYEARPGAEPAETTPPKTDTVHSVPDEPFNFNDLPV